MNIPYKKVEGGIIIEIRVAPRSSRAGIVSVSEKSVKVKLTSAPVDNAANRQLVELLAEEFRVKKSSIKIVRGEKSKNKLIKIEGIDSV
ncbi:MAG: DUF167 domain-containing protein [bacterium]